ITHARAHRRSTDAVIPRACAVLPPPYRLAKDRFRATLAPSSATPGRTVRHAPYRRFYRRRWLRLLRGLNFEPEEWICHGWGWLSSPLGFLVQSLSMKQAVFRRGIERLVGRALLSRASDTFVRSSALNWLAAEHIFRVRAIK